MKLASLLKEKLSRPWLSVCRIKGVGDNSPQEIA